MSETPDLSALQSQNRLIRSLAIAVYSQPDPSADPDLLSRLIQAQTQIHEPEETASPASPAASTSDRFLLSADTTGLSVKPTLRLDPLPTGVYHLLDPKTDPLLTVSIGNVARDTKRVRVKAFIEGLSAEAVRTVEIDHGETGEVALSPVLFPERARAITEVQRVTLHLLVEDLDGELECHDTFPLVCLSRNSSFNGIRDPSTGRIKHLYHYYGAWVTPNAEPVQRLIDRAAELRPKRGLWGFWKSPDPVQNQVEALYRALQEEKVVYAYAALDHGARRGTYTQRTRLPRESLEQKSANCMDGTVLMASLLEGVSLNPALVFVPGHAFLGWQKQEDGDDWGYLETTMISTATFEQACRSAEELYKKWKAADKVRLYALDDLRARDIWPME